MTPLEQLVDAYQGEAVRRHNRRHVIRRLTGHDEAGEELVCGEHDERNPEVEVPFLGSSLEMPIERSAHDGREEVMILAKDLLAGPPNIRIGPPNPPQILGQRV